MGYPKRSCKLSGTSRNDSIERAFYSGGELIASSNDINDEAQNKYAYIYENNDLNITGLRKITFYPTRANNNEDCVLALAGRHTHKNARSSWFFQRYIYKRSFLVKNDSFLTEIFGTEPVAEEDALKIDEKTLSGEEYCNRYREILIPENLKNDADFQALLIAFNEFYNGKTIIVRLRGNVGNNPEAMRLAAYDFLIKFYSAIPEPSRPNVGFSIFRTGTEIEEIADSKLRIFIVAHNQTIPTHPNFVCINLDNPNGASPESCFKLWFALSTVDRCLLSPKISAASYDMELNNFRKIMTDEKWWWYSLEGFQNITDLYILQENHQAAADVLQEELFMNKFFNNLEQYLDSKGLFWEDWTESLFQDEGDPVKKDGCIEYWKKTLANNSCRKSKEYSKRLCKVEEAYNKGKQLEQRTNELTENKRTLREKETNLQEKETNLQETQLKLTKITNTLHNTERELTDEKEKLAEANRQLEVRNKELEVKNKNIDDANKKLADKEKELKGTCDKLETATTEKNDLEKKLADKNNELSAAQKELKAAEREKESNKKTIEELQKKLESARDAEKLKPKLDGIKLKYSIFKLDMDRLTDSGSNKRSRIDSKNLITWLLLGAILLVGIISLLKNFNIFGKKEPIIEPVNTELPMTAEPANPTETPIATATPMPTPTATPVPTPPVAEFSAAVRPKYIWSAITQTENYEDFASDYDIIDAKNSEAKLKADGFSEAVAQNIRILADTETSFILVKCLHNPAGTSTEGNDAEKQSLVLIAAVNEDGDRVLQDLKNDAAYTYDENEGCEIMLFINFESSNPIWDSIKQDFNSIISEIKNNIAVFPTKVTSTILNALEDEAFRNISPLYIADENLSIDIKGLNIKSFTEGAQENEEIKYALYNIEGSEDDILLYLFIRYSENGEIEYSKSEASLIENAEWRIYETEVDTLKVQLFIFSEDSDIKEIFDEIAVANNWSRYLKEQSNGESAEPSVQPTNQPPKPPNPPKPTNQPTEPPTDEPPTEEPPTEELPTEEPPTDEPLTGEPPAEP